MKTTHRFLQADSRDLCQLPDESVDLIVTSPPHPMIEMWDDTFASLDPSIQNSLNKAGGDTAFELMHRQLDRVWREVFRLLRPGGSACVNVGDAARKIDGRFQLYKNHGRICSTLREIGFIPLPDVLWYKPRRFVESCLFPTGAYVTYDFEHVLIYVKVLGPSILSEEDKQLRRKSACFQEERDAWLADVWKDLPGASQGTRESAARERSGAFPLELPYRLVQMHSVYGDTILDPFVGTGTTSLAAAISGRNSIGVEIDESLLGTIRESLSGAVEVGKQRVEQRLRRHRGFVEERSSQGRPPKHTNHHYGFPVISEHESDLLLYRPEVIEQVGELRYEISNVVAELPAMV